MAVPLPADESFPPFVPPAADSVRSPCPALNALCNHNLLPHSGRDITPEMVLRVFKEVFNIHPSFAQDQAANGISTTADPATATSFSLEDMRRHNFIEHDGSLSRADVGLTGDSTAFDAEVWRGVVRDLLAGATTDGQRAAESDVVIGLDKAAKARSKRIARAKAENKGMVYGLTQWRLSLGQTALYLSCLGDGKSGKVRWDFVKVLFGEFFLLLFSGSCYECVVGGMARCVGVLKSCLREENERERRTSSAQSSILLDMPSNAYRYLVPLCILLEQGVNFFL